MKKRISKVLRKQITAVLRERGIKKAGVFGSFARGEEKKDSDIDILVEAKKGFSLLDLVGLELEIEKKTRKKVDLLTYRGINPLLKDRILKEEVRLI